MSSVSFYIGLRSRRDQGGVILPTLTPYLGPFLSFPSRFLLSKVVRVRLQPEHEQGAWIELEDSLHLEILEMADSSLSLSEMVEEFVEERLSREDEEEEEEGQDEKEEEEEEEIDEEEMERRAVEAVTDDVLGGLRSLYFKRLIEFGVHDG